MVKYLVSKLIDRVYLKIALKIFRDSPVLPPFFILSPGRSGSTLLRKEIIANTNANIPPETGDCIPMAAKAFINSLHTSWERRVKAVVDVFLSSDDFKLWGIDLKKYESDIVSKGEMTFQELVKSIYDQYAIKHQFSMDTWGDKTPYLTEKIEWIQAIFPQSKFIYIDRETEEIIASRMKSFSESYSQARNRVLLARKAILSAKEKGTSFFELRLDGLLKEPDATVDQVIGYLNIQRSKIRKNDFFLGDDILSHHGKLHKPLK